MKTVAKIKSVKKLTGGSTRAYIETSGGQSSKLNLNVHFFNTSVEHLRQLKTVVFLRWDLIRVVPLPVVCLL